MEPKKKSKILRRLKSKYRLVILNDASFEEKFSFRLAPVNLALLTFGLAFLLIVIVTLIIAYTPLRESIPGYTDVSLRQELTRLVLFTDSLEVELQQNKTYLDRITSILKGEIPENEQLTSPEDSQTIILEGLEKSKDDSLLREYVEREESYSLEEPGGSAAKQSNALYFFPPLIGTLNNQFDPINEHFGIDIIAPKNEAVKATLDGTVIFAEWTVETGYVIQLQHTNNLISVYKHNSILLKKPGEKVKAGEAIAIVGNSGKLTTGPHLHFELWQDGKAIDPAKYLNF